MKVFTFNTGAEWLETKPTFDQEENQKPTGKDSALEEIQRVLSDSFRANNLIILTGLGTSLYVNADFKAGSRNPLEGKKIAPTMADLWREAKAKSNENFSKIIKLTKFPENEPRLHENIEALLSYCKLGAEFNELEGKNLIEKFIRETEQIIREKVNFLTDGDEVPVHSELLRKIARRSNRKVRAKIFTTNYDLCFEHAARNGRFVSIDGFSHTLPQVFDSIYYSYDVVKRESNPDSHDYISNAYHFYKLHGSIDWEKNPKTNEIQRVSNTANPILVYPRNTKYELAFEQPYLEMMSAFQAALKQPETSLLIVGFGFNDNHLSEPILSAIRSNLSLKVVICNPSLAPHTEDTDPTKNFAGMTKLNEYLKKITYLISQGDSRLSLINGTFEELVHELPDIAALTDLEQHLERIRNLRGYESNYEKTSSN